MAMVSNLLKTRITYDIIVSDFGRDATIEYLRLVATSEKRLIKTILKRDDREFFDEYRRIMFTAVGDLAFFKESAIAQSATSSGYLTKDILIGLGPSPMSQEFVDRVALSVIQEVLAAMDRGHERLRILIPCNGLSVLAQKIKQVTCSVGELRRIVKAYALMTSDFDRVAAAHISVHTVPEAVIIYLAETKKVDEMTHLLVLGTRGVNTIYETLAESHDMNVLHVEDWEYELIDKAIVASIGGDQGEVDSCREQLQKELIEPRRGLFDDLVVLEACTDFHLGLGLSSLELFADAMVADCYQPKIHREAE